MRFHRRRVVARDDRLVLGIEGGDDVFVPGREAPAEFTARESGRGQRGQDRRRFVSTRTTFIS
jgi:hypothetical protein